MMHRIHRSLLSFLFTAIHINRMKQPDNGLSFALEYPHNTEERRVISQEGLLWSVPAAAMK
jgi:hypothetical protein